MQIDNEKYNRFLIQREHEDELFTYYRRIGVPVPHYNSTKFGLFLRFQRDVYRLFRQSNIKSPAAIRLFLYLVERCIGYYDDPKSEILFNVRKLMKECNIKSPKTFYEGVKYLQDRNIIFLLEKNCGKVLKINSSIKLWDLGDDNDRKYDIYQKEIDRVCSPSEG